MDPFLQFTLTLLGAVVVGLPVGIWLMPKLDRLGGHVSDWMEDRKARREAR